MLQCELARRERAQPILLGAAREFAKPQFIEALRRVEQDVPSRGQAAEQIHLVQQSRVLDDQRVGLQHRLAQANFLVVDAAERHDGRTHAFGAEAGKRLCVTPLEKCGNRQHFGAGYDTLAASAVNSNLEHRAFPVVLSRPPASEPWVRFELAFPSGKS